jgi:hypothetical protein
MMMVSTRAYMEPPPGPASIQSEGLWQNIPFLLLIVGLAGGVMVVALVRQAKHHQHELTAFSVVYNKARPANPAPAGPKI